MTTKIYSIRDQKAEFFNNPWFAKTHGEAERNFRSLVNDPKSMVSQYPLDYDLYYLGEYDTNTGKIAPLDAPQHIMQAISLVAKHPEIVKAESELKEFVQKQ